MSGSLPRSRQSVAWAIATAIVLAFAGLIAFVIWLAPSRAERAAHFAARCQEAGFNVQQCGFLYALEQQRADDENADLALITAATSAASPAARK